MSIVGACNSFYVMLFEKDAVGIASRCSPVKPYAVPLSHDEAACKYACSLTDTPVKFPPRPTSGIVNVRVREGLIEEYKKNPLIFTVQWSSPTTGAAAVQQEEEDPCCSCCSRHFLGFGFSQEMPYFPPGTIVQFVETTTTKTTTATITGMAASLGQRSNEYAIVLSLDKAVHPDAISAFIESYNMTEIDGGDDGLCACLANIVRKYTYTVGDVDPRCASTEAMEATVASKFQHELERMYESVQAALAPSHPNNAGLSTEELGRRTTQVNAIFRTYKETLFMQMRHQPLGTREWIQMFESYMSFAASEQGLGFMDFVLC